MSSPSPVINLVVDTIRVVAHTMGPVMPGGQLSQNHWSIYLIVANAGGSIRLNMATDPSSDSERGIFSVTRHTYEMTNSCVRYWDYPAATSTTAGDILSNIANNGRHRYNMTNNGTGCRYWIYTIISDLTRADLIQANALNHLQHAIQFNYSRGVEPVRLQVQVGSFF